MLFLKKMLEISKFVVLFNQFFFEILTRKVHLVKFKWLFIGNKRREFNMS